MLVVKNPPANAGNIRDPGLIPGSGRSPGGGHSNPLRYSCLENPTNRRAWRATVHRVTKSWTHWSIWARPHIYYLISKNVIVPVVPACKLESTLVAWPFRKNVSEPWSQRLWLFTYLHPHSNLLSYMSENWSVIYDLPS